MTWQRVAVFVALIVVVVAGCHAGSDPTATTSGRSPGTSESSLWPPCRGVNNISYAYVTQTGPLMLGPTARSATTTSRTLAEDLFVATCKAVALDANAAKWSHRLSRRNWLPRPGRVLFASRFTAQDEDDSL